MARTPNAEPGAARNRPAALLQRQDRQEPGAEGRREQANVSLLFDHSRSRHRRRARDEALQGRRHSDHQRRRASRFRRRRVLEADEPEHDAASQAQEHQR